MILVGVCGGRDYTEYETVRKAIMHVVEGYAGEHQVVIVQGGCPTGADAHARAVCEEEGINYLTAHALWKAQGKKAGPIRNGVMCRLGLDYVLAFPGGSGTQDMTDKCKARHIPISEVK